MKQPCHSNKIALLQSLLEALPFEVWQSRIALPLVIIFQTIHSRYATEVVFSRRLPSWQSLPYSSDKCMRASSRLAQPESYISLIQHKRIVITYSHSWKEGMMLSDMLWFDHSVCCSGCFWHIKGQKKESFHPHFIIRSTPKVSKARRRRFRSWRIFR